MVWRLLIFGPFSQWKLNKIETENCIGIWGRSWCCWKALSESDLIEFISQFSELRCESHWVLNGFCYWKFKQIAKTEFGRKTQLSTQYAHTFANGTGHTSIYQWVDLVKRYGLFICTKKDTISFAAPASSDLWALSFCSQVSSKLESSANIPSWFHSSMIPLPSVH